MKNSFYKLKKKEDRQSVLTLEKEKWIKKVEKKFILEMILDESQSKVSQKSALERV